MRPIADEKGFLFHDLLKKANKNRDNSTTTQLTEETVSQ
jgi:hypothetical protein